MTTEDDQLRATVEAIVARNKEGRESFSSMSSRLQTILLSGTDDDLERFIDGLATIGDEVRGADGEADPVGEAGIG